MESLFAQFAILSDQALCENNLEVEAYKAWAAMELKEIKEMAKAEYDSLVSVAERDRNMGKNMEKVATFAAKKYIEGAVNSAGASMRSAIKAIFSL
ncbi:hypothetical protein RND71_000526 [Anisodus tanguticus]|uniref:Uncharacterized protein n=1 Tax=Anisodus tanguticus TaxID=243964 RepID=A0AAE1SZ69_9SOLA|nr:hypothetical protein RND71_000526 [Anisodus tanguticus]